MYSQNTNENETYLSNERILEELGCGTNPFMGDVITSEGSSTNTRLSDDTYHYLQKKLSDATALLATQGDRENSLIQKLDQSSRECQELRNKNTSLKAEIQTLTERQVEVDQKLEVERRDKISLQTQIDSLEHEIKEEKERFRLCFEKLKEAESKIFGSDELAKKMYSLATDSCAQSDVLREEVGSLETLIETCKSAMSKLSEEKQELSTKLRVVETEYEGYEGTMQDALADIELLKDENVRQENYINETLNRFREISVHFDSMKTFVKQQQLKVEAYQKKLASYGDGDGTLREKVKTLEGEVIIAKKEMESQERCARLKVDDLQKTIESYKGDRKEFEKKYESLQGDMGRVREENIALKLKQDTMKSQVDDERMKGAEVKMQLERERQQNENIREELRESNNKTREIEMKLAEVSGKGVSLGNMTEVWDSERSNFNKSREDLKIELMNVRKIKEELQVKYEKSEKELAELQSKQEKREREFKEITEDRNHLKESMDKVSKKKESLESEVEEKDIKIATFSKSISEKEKQVVDLEEKLKHCQMIFMENDERFRMAEKKLKLLQEQCNEKQIMNEKLCQTMTETQQSLAVETQEKRDLEERLRDLRDEYERHRLESEHIRTRLTEELKRIKVIIQGEHEDRTKEKQAHQEAIYKLNNKLKEMADIIDTDRDQMMKLQDRVSMLTSRNDDMAKQITRLEEDILHREKTIKDLETSNAKEGESLVKYQDQVKRLEEELKQSNEEFDKFQTEVHLFEKFWRQQHKQSIVELQDELDSISAEK